jgi:NADH-quinone oxidoreductase subunit L
MFDNLETLMVLIPALPLAAALIIGLLGKPLLKQYSHWPCVGAIVLSCVCSLLLLRGVLALDGHAEGADAAKSIGIEKVHTLWTCADITHAFDEPVAGGAGGANTLVARDLIIDVTLRADPLTSIMLTMVTFISSLVAIYAIGYMKDDPGYWRFFAYVSLFVFSMTMLVSSSNFVLLYVFWEAVGVCSYLLVGFWFEKPEAAAAGKKAFLVNRIGDFGFALGVFLIWITYGTLNFHDTPGGVAGVLGQQHLHNPTEFVGGTTGLLIVLFLFVGACGKSAQFPLHVWLPDAMEGPTPVSALIHAATMVTAGVYMVTRCTPLFMVSPEAQLVVAVIGGFTALLAGLIAITQTDLKRVLAYSTVSQLGYMFLGLGTGTLAGITAGMFHLFTHAFFKALLFLGAGSVMHAMGHVIDMRRFSGLRHIMPKTFYTFWLGALALAGIVPFAGFWSKDAIVASVHEKMHGEGGSYGTVYEWLYYASLFTALLTAFYTFRALFMTFYGEEKIPPEAGHHAHESPSTMTVPLMILAFFAAVVGAWFEYTHGFAHFLGMTPMLAYKTIQDTLPDGKFVFHMDVALTSTVIALLGMGLAAYLYLGNRSEIEQLTRLAKTARVYQLSYGKFFIDQIYGVLVIWPFRLLASLAYWFDRWVIDGLVNLCGKIAPLIGAVLRALQTGLVQFYALAMVLGMLVLIGTLLMWE